MLENIFRLLLEEQAALKVHLPKSVSIAPEIS
jgi:hypothetical protein